MKMTPELKAKFDALSYEELLYKNRYEPSGSGLYEGETGGYLIRRLDKLRVEVGHAAAVRASKSVGWDGP